MSRAKVLAVAFLLLAAGEAAHAAPTVGPLTDGWFDPNGIALSFTRTPEVAEPDDAWEGPAITHFRFQPTNEGDLVMRLVQGSTNPAVRVDVVREDVLRWSGITISPGLLPTYVRTEVARIEPTHTILRATGFQAEESILPSLTRLRRKLFFSVGAYDQTADSNHGADARWDGLACDEVGAEGRTVDAGMVRGDLTVSVGTVGTDTTLGQVFSGQAGILALNPFRDVSAQFDLAILGSGTNEWGECKDLRVFVLRVRAAYLGAFEHLNGNTSNDSELGVAFGVKW